jgi:hypothetical protein
MPKKKLTKAQVKSKLKTIQRAMYDLVLDKLGHADSRVPISQGKLMDLNKAMLLAFNRVK